MLLVKRSKRAEICVNIPLNKKTVLLHLGFA